MRPLPAALATSLMMAVLTGPVLAQDKPSGEITVWSWNIAAEALAALVPAFNERYPDVKVSVANMGHADVHDRALAGCAAGGADLPDVVTVENAEAELYWSRFPDCFTDLNEFGYERYADAFPAFKLPELRVGDAVYAMPWDSGPVVMFYRRDYYQQAGVDPASIETWDDFIAAGEKIKAATDGKVTMATIELGGDDEWFRILANQAGCFYFDFEGESVTVNQPGCVTALETIKKINDAGLFSVGGWDEKIQYFKAGTVATALFGGWYEGTIRSNAPEQAGKWGTYLIPAIEPGGGRAANDGGSSLAIPASSDNKAAAWAFIEYALATTEGQVSMLKSRGLVPSLLAALEDAYVKAPQDYWGGQPIWAEMLATMDDIKPYRGTPYYWDARPITTTIVKEYIDGSHSSAKEALDAAAEEIAAATGLPIKE